MFSPVLLAAAAAPSSSVGVLQWFMTAIRDLGQHTNWTLLAEVAVMPLLSGNWPGAVAAIVSHIKEIFPYADPATITAQIQGLPAPSFA